ncbi:MAG: DUF5710 domain-containing protein [Pseudonocardia sp.]
MVQHSAQTCARAYLDVPYADKDAAKALGARWDPHAKRWYDPNPPSAGLDRWAAAPDVPDLLPAEDRDFGSGLFVDLVPEYRRRVLIPVVRYSPWAVSFPPGRLLHQALPV